MIEVKLAHYKGAKRRPKPWVDDPPPPVSPLIWSETELIDYYSTIFFFTEVDDLIFYLITYLVSLAIIDEAFKATSLTTIKRVFEHKV
jgi:hypothetical protein